MKRTFQIALWMMLVLLCGCQQKKQEKALLSASHAPFVYSEIKEADCMTVNEEGLLYTCVWYPPEDTGPVLATERVYQPHEQQISVYDTEGNCVEQKMLKFGNGTCSNMLFHGGILYCVVSHMDYGCPVLYAVDTKQWTVTEVAVLKNYAMVSYLEIVGEFFYILGVYKSPSDKEYSDVQAQAYQNNCISRIKIAGEQAKPEKMNVELPVAMYKTDRNVLVIYRYIDGEGFGFLEFDQQKGTLNDAGRRTTSKNIENFGGCNDGYLYTCRQNDGEYLYYGTSDGTEAQVYPNKVQLNRPVVYKKGFAFFYNRADEKAYRICIEDILKENKTIQFLQMELSPDFPYGCGFQMEKNVVTGEEFALKVLAQDRDFDLFLLSSRSNVSDSIRKNGVFYTLNEVDGVEEYLNACFPYLNDLARNEEGDIWMVPVMLAVPGIVYNKEYCKMQSVDLPGMNFAEFTDFTENVQKENPNYVDISSYVCREEFLRQYLSKYTTFQTDLFRGYAKIMKQIYDKEWIFHGAISAGMSYDADILPGMEEEYPLQTKGELPEFYYYYNIYSGDLKTLQNNLGDMETVGMLGVPKLEADMKNCGTLTFMAVNPQSENLEATLNYISAFANYMLTKQDSFLLADESTYTDTPFTKEWYRLYADGEVYFEVDSEVYLSTFEEYLEGKIDLETAITEMERRRNLYLEE